MLIYRVEIMITSLKPACVHLSEPRLIQRTYSLWFSHLIYKVSQIHLDGPDQADRAQVDRRQGAWGVGQGALVKMRGAMRWLA